MKMMDTGYIYQKFAGKYYNYIGYICNEIIMRMMPERILNIQAQDF